MEPIFTITHAAQVMHRHGLTLPQALILLSVSEEARKMSDLATILNYSTAAITGQVDALVKRGLVQREHSEADRRCVNVSPTMAGLELVQSMQESFSKEVN